ncbi:MAG: hypothetical protein HZA31_00395 [Opitutae bacterium]|nr:hypothetical protein [Opitutae bacterium]
MSSFLARIFSGLLGVGLLCAGATAAPLPAFPTAEGFGALATGGRGGEVYHVTNLSDSGPGSLREAVSHGPRIVVFDVGGVIKLHSPLHIGSDLTIAGQTAPGDGVVIYGRSVLLQGSRNVIVRFVRLREGVAGEKGRGALQLSSASNIIFDHVSIAWGRWENLGVTQGSTAITFQYCIIGESLEPPRAGAPSGSARDITFSHNLWLHNQGRNLKAKGRIQYINNVVYNWSGTGLAGMRSSTEHNLDIVGNYFIQGPSASARFLGQFTFMDKVYQHDNFVDLDRDGQLDGRPVVEADFADTGGAPTFVPAPLLQPAIPVHVDTAEDAFRKVVARAGCSLRRDTVDTRLINELTSLGRRGRLIHDEAAVGGIGAFKSGQVTADALGDGMPDAWKTSHGFDPKDPRVARGDQDHDGYTNLEEYLNELAGDQPAN